jgi:transcriptional regulator with XRE-family HTH domain
MDRNALRDTLVGRRKELGFSQTDVAERADIARNYLSEIETGERTPSVPVAKRLGPVLGLPWTIFYEVAEPSRAATA